MSLVMSIRFIFGHDWNASYVHHVSLISVYLHTRSKQKQIVENDIERKYPVEYSTVDKVGVEKLLARKSYFVKN